MIKLASGEEYFTFLRKDSNEFDLNNIIINLNSEFGIINKPQKAFWGSPVNAKFGWKEWCEAESFGACDYNWDNPVKWKLKTGSKILKIELKDVIDEANSILKKYTKQNSLHATRQLSFEFSRLVYTNHLEQASSLYSSNLR